MITARKIFRFKIIFYGIFVGLQSNHKLILIIMHMNNALKFKGFSTCSSACTCN